MLTRIVIVEDDENWIKIIKDSLEENLKKGAYKVFSIKYENEITTLNEVVAIEPDFAILDINMANSSRAGIRLAEKIKRKIPNLEFRFLTSQKEKDPEPDDNEDISDEEFLEKMINDCVIEYSDDPVVTLEENREWCTCYWSEVVVIIDETDAEYFKQNNEFTEKTRKEIDKQEQYCTSELNKKIENREKKIENNI